MSKYDEFKVQKRAKWQSLWDETLKSELYRDATEEELVDLLIVIKSEMHLERILEVRTFDSRELLDAILSVRKYLEIQVSDASKNPLKAKADAKKLYEQETSELLDFMMEVHRIVAAQRKLGDSGAFADEDKEIKQELYKLFDRDGISKGLRQVEKWQMMIRLIILALPQGDEKARKKWAQREFVERGVWTEKNKGWQWKALAQYWSGSGDIWSEGNIESDDEEMSIFWNALLDLQRIERRKKPSKNSP